MKNPTYLILIMDHESLTKLKTLRKLFCTQKCIENLSLHSFSTTPFSLVVYFNQRMGLRMLFTSQNVSFWYFIIFFLRKWEKEEKAQRERKYRKNKNTKEGSERGYALITVIISTLSIKRGEKFLQNGGDATSNFKTKYKCLIVFFKYFRRPLSAKFALLTTCILSVLRHFFE